MTHKQVAAMAIRVLAIYAIINSLGWLQNGLMQLFIATSSGARLSTAPQFSYMLALLPFTVFAAFGVLLWGLADALAYFMCGGEDRDALAIRLPAIQILTLAFGVAGLWFALSALPRLFQSIGTALLVGANPSVSRFVGVGSLPSELVIGGAQIAIGLVLFFAARPFAGRVASHYRLAPPVENESASDAENFS